MNYSLFVPDDKTFPEHESDDFDKGYNFARIESIKKLEQNLPAHDAKIREEVLEEVLKSVEKVSVMVCYECDGGKELKEEVLKVINEIKNKE